MNHPPQGTGARFTLPQFIRYLLVGVTNTAIGYGLIFGFMYLAGLSPEASNAAGYGISLMVSYLLNRHYTFNSRGAQRGEVMRFLAAFAVAYALNFVTLVLLVRVAGAHEGVSQIVSGAIYVIASYFMNKFFVFRAQRAG